MIRWECDRGAVKPAFADAVDACLAPLPDEWVVYDALRDIAAEVVLYKRYLAGGPLAAKPGRSAHNYGLAADVVLIVDGKRTWDTTTYAEAWARLWAAIRAAPHLHSGHDFPKDTNNLVEADDDHIESTEWFALKSQLKDQGKW